MKQREIVFDDITRDEITMPPEVIKPIPLQYGIWEKLPTIGSLFLPDQLPSDYAFMGWTTVLGGNTDYIDGEYVKNLASPGSYQPLYGTWIRRYYYINYNANGGVIEAPSGEDPDYRKTQLVYSVDDVTLPSSGGAIKRDGGWQLDGWSKVPYGLVGYAPGSKQKGLFSDFNTGTLYAIWKPAEYTVKFHSNWPKGDADESTADQTLKYNIISKLRKNTFTFTHWEFIGWATSPEGHVAYIDEQRIVNLSEGEDVHLYARWKQIEFVMTFHRNAPNIEEGDYPIVTDNDITGNMPEEVFELDKPKTIDLNRFVYPKTIAGRETRDRAFDGWLDEPGGYTEEDQGHGRIKWVNCQEIILDHDVNVYAYWDDCIYIEYDATNFKKLKKDFEREYQLLVEMGIYKLTDRVHPGTKYKVRDDFLKTLYGCNLAAWGSKEAVNFRPGDVIHADLFDAGEHFELTPLYQKRQEIYNAKDKGDTVSWGIDSKKTKDKTYLSGLSHLKLFEILPRSDYVEEYLDINISINTLYKSKGGAVTIYWLPESNPDCKFKKLYEVKSGTSKGNYKQTKTISVPGWFVKKKNRYVYYLLVVWCPYGVEPGQVKNWGDPNIKLVRGLGKKWHKWKNKITNVATVGLCAVAPTTALVLKPTRDRIKSATDKSFKELARVKIAGHHTGKAIVKAVASKEFTIAMSAVSAIASLVTAGAAGGVMAWTSAALSSAASACTIVSATSNDKGTKKYLDAASIGLSVAALGVSIAASSNASTKLTEATDMKVYLTTTDDVAAGQLNRANQLSSNFLRAAEAETNVAANANMELLGLVEGTPAYNATMAGMNEALREAGDYLAQSSIQQSWANIWSGVHSVTHTAATASTAEVLKTATVLTETLNHTATTALVTAINIGLRVGPLRDILNTYNGISSITEKDIDKIYVRTSDGNMFVKLRGGTVIEIKTPGINWKPICIVSALTIDSIIYPANDQGIVFHNQ